MKRQSWQINALSAAAKGNNQFKNMKPDIELVKDGKVMAAFNFIEGYSQEQTKRDARIYAKPYGWEVRMCA